MFQGKPPTKKAKVLQKQPLVAKLAAYAQYQATLQNQAKTKAGNSGKCNKGEVLLVQLASRNSILTLGCVWVVCVFCWHI